MKLDFNELFESSGMSKKKFTDFVGISFPTLQTMLAGEAVTVNLQTLENICNVLKCTPNDILIFDKQEDTRDPNQIIQNIVSGIEAIGVDVNPLQYINFDSLPHDISATVKREQSETGENLFKIIFTKNQN